VGGRTQKKPDCSYKLVIIDTHMVPNRQRGYRGWVGHRLSDFAVAYQDLLLRITLRNSVKIAIDRERSMSKRVRM